MSRRAQIVQAALAIVNEEGAEAMSVRNVAARAGIGASTLRYYFPTHRDLVNAVVDAATAQTLGDMNIHDSNSPARSRLAECLNQFLPQADDEVPVLEALVSAYASCFSDGKLIGNPQLAQVGSVSRERIRSWLQVLEAEGQNLPLPAAQLVRVVLSSINGVAIDVMIEAPEFTVEEARHEIQKLVTLVLPDEDSPQASNDVPARTNNPD